LTQDGDLFGFGAGTYGEIGWGETKDSSIPRKIELNT
jgi:alpha-tubulin suppressor-like RCC1 family protein